MRCLVISALAFMLSLPVVAQDFQKGLEAYERGDYATALQVLRPLAKQGDAPAQYNLAVLYHNGQGVPQEYTEAVTWYRQAAEQGNAAAQNNLAAMYGQGLGVPQDSVQAHMWFSLAAAYGNENAKTNRNIAEKKMSPAGLAKAQRLAREWMEKHGK